MGGGQRSGSGESCVCGLYLCLCTHGIEGTLDDEPAFAEHVAALARLRKKCAERTVHARFNHTRGIEVKTSNGLVAYSYDGEKGPAVIATAPGKAKRGTVTVNCDMFAARGKKAGIVHRLDGSSETVKGDTFTFDLKENEVAVWEL